MTMLSMGAAALFLLSSAAHPASSCQAHKINVHHRGKRPPAAGFITPLLKGNRALLDPRTTMPTFDLAPIDESTPSTSANNNGIPSMLFRWQRNKIQLCAKNKRNSASSVNVDEAQDGIADQSILNGSDNDDVELNGLIEDALDAAPHDISPLILGTTNGEIHNDEYNTVGEDTIEKVIDEVEKRHDMEMMRMAIGMAASSGGERGSHGPFPRPVCGAVLVAKDGRILGKGRSDYAGHAVEYAFREAGISATPLREWCVSWPSDSRFRQDIAESTLYITLEPSNERMGDEKPPITQLIEMANIPRLVIGCQDPIPEQAAKGAGTLHAAGVSVSMGILQEDCQHLIEGYAQLANSKLQRMARQHMKRFGRPMGHLHCSVIDSDDAEAFIRNGNSFGKNFGGQHLSYRDFGTYEIAPPPESIWATGDDSTDEFSSEIDDFFKIDFEDEDLQETSGMNPMMPWYEQVDACVATFPKAGDGPVDDSSIQARLKGLIWLATNGKSLPAGVERVLVMDATDLEDLPLTNDDPTLPPGVDVEEFWSADGRKPSRVLLRHGDVLRFPTYLIPKNAVAIAVAKAAAKAAAAAAEAAAKAKAAIETGDAELAAEAALQCQEAAMASNKFIQGEIQKTQDLKQRLVNLGVKVEVIKGCNPIDVMEHLGKRSGYNSVVWRAGCWGNSGVEAILAGAFQRVSAHLAVDAIGGKFWQLMLAERALQSACGPEREIKVFAEQDDISLEYCDRDGADKDCALLFDGRPVRHVRLDARVAVIDEIKRKKQTMAKTVPMKKFREEEAPWFL
ncbi:hypothetical protein ACHAWU_004809 [Discostella pseudostelligera]|uniref:CMP/dCMP-type deaminase domain-containing protein n=1 Tax=Discostella pseudostelligera TaxID=259834 RepID=A0ABD3M600_9STRA